MKVLVCKAELDHVNYDPYKLVTLSTNRHDCLKWSKQKLPQIKDLIMYHSDHFNTWTDLISR